MPLLVCLQDEDGEIEDKAEEPSVLSKPVYKPWIPAIRDRTFRVVCFIDPWGDAMFNNSQMPDFLEEWERIRPSGMDDKSRQFWDHVAAMARRCRDDVHMYIKFSGD